MRHLKRTAKLGRTSVHRNAMLANLVCSLIKHKRVTTTLAKAKAGRSVAEKMITLGKSGSIFARRTVAARLHVRGTTNQLTKEERRKWREQEDIVRILFDEIAPAFKERNGGYTRIVRMGQRQGDAAQLAILEWVDYVPPAPAPVEAAAPTEETKPGETKPAETKPVEAKQAETKPSKAKAAKK
jgi:large subunit ribosomal protein L17